MTEKEFFENAGKYLSGEGDQKPQEKDFAPLEQVWEQAGTFRYSEEEENDSAWARMQDRMNAAPVLQVSHVRRNVWFAAVAAAVLLLISGGIFVVYKQMNEVELQAAIERSTGTNEIATLTLNDGTVIVMNASTKISVPAGFGTTHRHLSLTGQADFEVARNEKLPFEVKTGSATTRVLGTGFDISAYPGEAVLIQVKHGKVEFGTEQQHVTLLKGNGARLQDGTALSTFDVSGKPGGWKTGELIFDKARLSDIALQLQHKYGRKLKYDESAANKEFTGNFQNSATLDEIVQVITAALQVSITIE